MLLTLLFVGLNGYSQNPIKFRWSASVTGDASDTVKTNIQGTNLKKGNTFVMYLAAAGNGNTTTRQLLLDFQYQNTALELISIANTGTGGNGGVLPQNSNAQESYYQYPGYSFISSQQNTTSNGTTNYQYSSYSYLQGGPNTIVRYNLTWSGTSGMPYSGYWSMIKLTFKVKDSLVGFNMDPVKLNFVAAWTGTGILDNTLQENPLREVIYLNPNPDSYVNAKIDINANLTTIAPAKVVFYDTLAKIGHLFDITSNGTVNVDQTKLKANTTYKVQTMINMDKLYDLYNAAVTVSDFTGPQNEFVKTNLDGTPALINMTTGASFLAADVNSDKKFDGSDLPILLTNALAQDTLVMLPQGYVVGSGGFMSVWTFRDTAFNNMTPNSWKTADLGGVFFRTQNIGDYLPLNLKYLLWGDVNRSHSSQVVRENNTIVTSANFSLKTAGLFSNSMTSTAYANTTQEVKTIDVSLNNTTVTSNTVNIPINVSTNGAGVSALQFEFQYDPNKIKFEELQSNLPNTWYTFANSKSGKVKFGALDRGTNGMPLNGNSTPFTLKFSTIGNGVDILTSVKVTPVMDASDTNGNQLGIKLNTTQIKLTGYNNF